VQQQIHEAAYRWQREVESGARTIVGVNRFAEDEGTPAPPFRPDASADRERTAFLAAWRRERNAKAAAAALSRLDRAARGSANLMPSILEALRSTARSAKCAT
jgi:methylmalonyl-CoA mutase N-terminal domain/subunit